jgi:hypothetical protein
VEDSPREAVEDPIVAAVVMMYAISQDAGPATPAVEDAIRREVTTSMGIKDPTEVMVFAKWVASHVTDPNNVSLRYAKLGIAALNQPERQEFFDMVEQVAAAGTIIAPNRAILDKLRERLALVH